MIRALLVAALALACAGAGPATADEGAARTRSVAIPFAASGGVKSWRSGGQNAILIEARSGRWYRGEFYGACPEVRASEAVGFTTSASGALDRHSRIIVRDRACRLKSLTEAANPRRVAGT